MNWKTRKYCVSQISAEMLWGWIIFFSNCNICWLAPPPIYCPKRLCGGVFFVPSTNNNILSACYVWTWMYIDLYRIFWVVKILLSKSTKHTQKPKWLKPHQLEKLRAINISIYNTRKARNAPGNRFITLNFNLNHIAAPKKAKWKNWKRRKTNNINYIRRRCALYDVRGGRNLYSTVWWPQYLWSR